MKLDVGSVCVCVCVRAHGCLVILFMVLLCWKHFSDEGRGPGVGNTWGSSTPRNCLLLARKLKWSCLQRGSTSLTTPFHVLHQNFSLRDHQVFPLDSATWDHQSILVIPEGNWGSEQGGDKPHVSKLVAGARIRTWGSWLPAPSSVTALWLEIRRWPEGRGMCV